MSNRTTLKGYFVTNAIPKQSDFADLIDSALVQPEDSIRKQGADPVALQAQQADQNGIQQVLHFYKNFNDANAAWKLSLLDQNSTNPASGLNIGSSTAQNALFIKESDGSIGIGTNNPRAKLHISGGNAVVEGNAGIGTTTPATRLDVNGMAWFRNNPGGGLDSAAGQGVKITTENNVGYIFSYDYASSKPLDLVLQGAGGNVGINVAAPLRSKLDIGILTKGQLGSVFGRLQEGDTIKEGTFLGVRGYKTQPENPAVAEDIKSFAIEHSFYGQVNSAVNFFRGGDRTGGFLTFCTNNNTERVRIDPNGHVGIGKTNPEVPLDIQGGAYITLAGFHYFDNNTSGSGVATNTGGNSWPISIRTDGAIVTNKGFYCTSDIRLKKNLVESDTEKGLTLLNQLKVTDYQFKDCVTQGSRTNKGLIAQEVEKIFPQAVEKGSGYLPNILAIADKVAVSNNVLTISMNAPHHLNSGDLVRLITDSDGIKEVPIFVTDDKTFQIKNWNFNTNEIFVYGKKVNNLLTINYQQIFTLSISAIQELYKQLQGLREELKAIKEKIPFLFAPAM